MLTHTVSQIDVFVWAVRLYTLTDCISHLLLIWDLMAFPNNVVPMHNVLLKCLLGQFVKCWDLSPLLSLAQTLCPNQCSRVWRDSLSPAIIHQATASLVCLGPSKWDKWEFQIQWILMQPLRPMLTYVCVLLNVSKEEDKEDQLVDSFVSATIQTATGNKPSDVFISISLPIFGPVATILKKCTLLKCHAHLKDCNCSSWRNWIDLATALYSYDTWVKDLLMSWIKSYNIFGLSLWCSYSRYAWHA